MTTSFIFRRFERGNALGDSTGVEILIHEMKKGKSLEIDVWKDLDWIFGRSCSTYDAGFFNAELLSMMPTVR
jgi:hypothetical protein